MRREFSKISRVHKHCQQLTFVWSTAISRVHLVTVYSSISAVDSANGLAVPEVLIPLYIVVVAIGSLIVSIPDSGGGGGSGSLKTMKTSQDAKFR